MEHAAVTPETGDATVVADARRSGVADLAAEPRTLLDLLDGAFARYADQPAVGHWHDDGTKTTWSYRELDRRSRLAAWRLREELGLRPGDRVLTWSPSSPALPAAYFGAMRAGLILVPLDLRMSSDAIGAIVARAEPRRLLLGTGHDAPDPASAGLADFPTTTIDELTAEPPEPGRGDEMVRATGEWPRPRPEDIWDLIFTSGTTGTPKGVMLAHDNEIAAVESFHRLVPRMEHRIVSLLPLSHLLEQSVGLYYALSVGADILYVRSRNPRVIFDALREHRVTSMVVVPQVLDLFWTAVEREVAKRDRETAFNRLRAIARRLPMGWRPTLFRSVHRQLGGHFRLFLSAGAFLPPALQQAWEDLGVTVLQGYGATETGTGSCTTLQDHGLGTVGRPPAGIEMRIADDGEIQFRGPTVFRGYWENPEATAAAFTADGWYQTGDIGHFDPEGRLILSGRKKDMIVLPNGFNVYPEDIENALRIAGIRDSVVLETEAGKIEAVVLASAAGPPRAPGAHAEGVPADPAALRETVDAAVKAANGTLGANQRIAAWRLWPEEDFPRTHTLKIKRSLIRDWIAAGTTKTG